MADTTTELEVLDQIVDTLGGQSGQYETVVPTLQQILALLGGGGGGYNPSLSVGRADALTGADETAQWAQRESTGSGAATVRSVQGAAVAWNQMLPAVTESSWFVAAATKNVVVNVAEVTPSSQYGRISFRGIEIVTSHVYLCELDFKILSDGSFSVYTSSNMQFENLLGNVSGSDQWRHSSQIRTATANNAGTNLIINVQDNRASGWDTWSIKNAMLIDLTLMFGAGNEPATVAEFERMFPKSYYPYSAPTLKPVQIAGIASTDAQGGELDSIEWTAQTLRAAGSVADMLYADHVDVRVGAYTFTGSERASVQNWLPTDSTYAALFPLSMIPDRAAHSYHSGQYSTAVMAGLNTQEYGELYGGSGTGFTMATSPTDHNYSFIVRVPKTIASTQAELMSWLAGQTVFYQLATPTTQPISPALPMTYRVEQGGSESIIVPDGEVSAAPVITVAEGESAAELVMDALACIATPDGPIATSNHALNTYLTMGGKLYKVTSAIAVGESIAPNTNVTETTVMAELIARTA